MRQALHIFLKDVRGLRSQIALLMALIACFVWVDLHTISNLVVAMEAILTVAVWFLIARTIHEDGLADDDEFWLTRPYERGSLLGAKVLMAVFVVAVPLFIADAAILATQSMSVTEHLGGLALRQLYVSLWLIVPPFAISAVTRTAAQNVVAWIAMAAIAVLTWFPGLVGTNNDFRLENEKYALAAALVIAGVAAWVQFSCRRTLLTRVMVAVAILLPSPPFPESAALAIEQMRNSEPELTSRIAVTAGAQSVVEAADSAYRGSWHCVNVPLRVEGVPAGWNVAVLSQNDHLALEGRTWSSGWHQGMSRADSLSVCKAGNMESQLASLHTSIALAVYRPEKPFRIPATLNEFEAPGIGTCRFAPAMEKQYVLVCRAAVWTPSSGEVGVAGKVSPSAPIAPVEFPWTPFGLMPGLSPIYRWTTLQMDAGRDQYDPKTGEMPSFGLRTLMNAGGEIEFRSTKRVAVLRREISVRQVRFR